MQTDPAVSAFLKELDHPLKGAIAELRKIILGTSPEIHEGIKWKVPSFRTADYFATLNFRAKVGQENFLLILHNGAKVKDSAITGIKVADPAGLLQWRAKDRCLMSFQSTMDVRSKRPAIEAIKHL